MPFFLRWLTRNLPVYAARARHCYLSFLGLAQTLFVCQTFRNYKNQTKYCSVLPCCNTIFLKCFYLSQAKMFRNFYQKIAQQILLSTMFCDVAKRPNMICCPIMLKQISNVWQFSINWRGPCASNAYAAAHATPHVLSDAFPTNA